MTQCGLSGDGTSDTCCNATGQCLSAFGGVSSHAVGQSNDLLVGDGILFKGTGWNAGTPVQIFWDPSHIGACTPDSGGGFNNAGTTATNTTCSNLTCATPPCIDIVPTDPSQSSSGYPVQSFDSVDGPCTSHVRAVQGAVEVDAELDGIVQGEVIFSRLGPKQASIIAGGDSPAAGDTTCQFASGLSIAVTPGSALVEVNSGQGVAVWANNNTVVTQNAAVTSGHTMFLGLGDETAAVAPLPAGPNPSSFKPPSCDQHLTSPQGSTSLSGTACADTDLVINGDLKMSGALLFVSGNLTVNGAVKGNGAAIATGQTVVTGAVSFQTDDVFSFVTGGDLYLCGDTPGCAPGSASPTPTAKATPTASATSRTTPSPTRRATPTATRKPTPSPTPAAPPTLSSIPGTIRAGSSFTINGAGFTNGSVANFFVATSTGPVNAGPFTPSARSLPTQLTITVPPTTPLGQGFVTIQVVNTDKGFAASNTLSALLQGSVAAGLPSLTSVNGVGLAPTSSDPHFATNNVETVVAQGTLVKLGGSGFDTINGVAVDLFCACSAGKVGPFFVNPGDPGLSAAQVSFALPGSGSMAPATGPGSFVVSNAGAAKTYTKKSNAVSVPIGQKISVASVTQSGGVITVNGTGFSRLTVINLFNAQGGGVVNLGGLAGGAPNLPLSLVNSTRFTFARPKTGAAGPAYVQAINPPFVPFTSSGNDPGGAFTLK